MVELVDTTDLKSVDIVRPGSSPGASTIMENKYWQLTMRRSIV